MVDKITTTPTTGGVISKINEIIDNLGGGSSGLAYSAECPAITIASGVATWAVTHNLGTTNVIANLYNVSTGAEIEKNIVVNSANAITVTFVASSNVSAGDYKIVVLASGANANTSNLADINLSNLSSTGTKVLDGQWVAVNEWIANTATTTGVDYDLSDYLPNDNYNYEILLYGQVNVNVSNGSYRNLCVSSSIITSECSICAARQASSTSATSTGTLIIAIGTNRKITVTERTSDKGNYNLWFKAYRRIGTNA